MIGPSGERAKKFRAPRSDFMEILKAAAFAGRVSFVAITGGVVFSDSESLASRPEIGYA